LPPQSRVADVGTWKSTFALNAKPCPMTPAMEAGVSDHVWALEEIASLVIEPIAKKRGPYKKRVSEES
jgi:hypothetical protein